MNDVWSAASEVEFVEKTRYEGSGLSVGEGDEEDSFGETVYHGQGFGFARDGEALALEIHRVSGTGFGRIVR